MVMATKTLNVRMQQLYRPNTEWSGKTLLIGELGIDNTYNAVKIGDGFTLFEALPAYGWIPPGTIICSGYQGWNTPLGYLDCDGSAVSRTVYADLFKAIGTSYGAGNGSTTFNVPDFRDKFIKCVSNFATFGKSSGGQSTVVLTESQIPPHKHGIHYGVNTSGPGNLISALSNPTEYTSSNPINNTGGGAAHNNTPAYLEASIFIKY